MKVQRILLAEHQYTWLVLDDDHHSIKPIESFIRYLNHTEKSPDTIRAYANHLKLYWEFLQFRHKDWIEVNLNDFSHFVHWLRSSHTDVISIAGDGHARRMETTVNTILTAVSSFYRYHNQLGNTSIHLTEPFHSPVNRHKSLLYHVYKNKPLQKRIISLKQPKDLPKTLSTSQITHLLDACTNIRDKFLVSLLYESGLRIGQALSLKHTDIKTWDNEIHVIFRKNNANQMRNKSMRPNVVHVSINLMQLYSEYITSDYYNQESEYVFINYKTQKPLSYGAVKNVFIHLSKKVGINIRPHMLRHTHATELVRSGWDASFVQKRLGHAHVQTTIDTYLHINQDDLKRAFQQYQSKMGKQ